MKTYFYYFSHGIELIYNLMFNSQKKVTRRKFELLQNERDLYLSESIRSFDLNNNDNEQMNDFIAAQRSVGSVRVLKVGDKIIVVRL